MGLARPASRTEPAAGPPTQCSVSWPASELAFSHGDRRRSPAHRLRHRSSPSTRRTTYRPAARAPRARLRSRAGRTRRCTAVGRGRPPVRGLRLRRGDERALPTSSAGRRALGRVRPSHAARLRLRRPPRRGRGRPHGRRDRLDRGHARAARRHPARRGLDVDDDQRACRAPAPAVRARRGGAGSRARGAARDGAERRPQGVRGARELHFRHGRRCGSRPISSVLRRAAAALEHDLDLRVPHPRGGASAARGSPSRSRTGSPTARRRSRRASRPTTSASASPSSSTRTTTSSRRSPSSEAARRLGADHERAIRRDESARDSAPLPRPDWRLDAHRTAAGDQHRAGRDPGAVGGRRRRSRCTRTPTTRRSRSPRARRAIALGHQQILASEAGGTDTANALGGAYIIEALTDELERSLGAHRARRRSSEARGSDRAGLRAGEIEASAFRYPPRWREASGSSSASTASPTTMPSASNCSRSTPRASATSEADGTRPSGTRLRCRRAALAEGDRSGGDRREPASSDARGPPPTARSARSATPCAGCGVHMTPSMRRRRIALALAVLLVPIAAIAASNGSGGYSGPGVTPSFTPTSRRSSSRSARAVTRSGGIAPFALVTGKQISSRAASSARPCRRAHAAVASRRCVAELRRGGDRS